jgi:adenylate kinase family enzyme
VIILDIFAYNRIIIVGNNGSGKSFLAKELSAITGLPLVHFDVEFWRPNWEEPPKEEWIKNKWSSQQRKSG